MLGHETSFNKFLKIEIVSSIFSNHSGMKLDINYKKKTGKFRNVWRLNNVLLNSQSVKEINRETNTVLESLDSS